MNSQPLVSLLTPVYNGVQYIGRLFDSILAQDYPNIEMIVINDGSTDETSSMIACYQDKFRQKGYSLTEYYQENQGLASSINNGLKYITGDYFIWPDCDDYFSSPTSIRHYVDGVLNSGCEISRCLIEFIDEDTQAVTNQMKWEGADIVNLFEDCLYIKNGFGFNAGSWIVSVKALDECIPGRNIYTDRTAGQNYQLLLPILYKYDCFTIKEHLYTIVLRSASLSHEDTLDYEKIVSRYLSYQNSLLCTLDTIAGLPVDKKQAYVRDIKEKYAKFLFRLGVKFGKKENAAKYKHILEHELEVKIHWVWLLLFLFSRFSPYIRLKNSVFGQLLR